MMIEKNLKTDSGKFPLHVNLPPYRIWLKHVINVWPLSFRLSSFHFQAPAATGVVCVYAYMSLPTFVFVLPDYKNIYLAKVFSMYLGHRVT